MKDVKIGTRCLHGGYTPQNGEPRQIPIIQSTTFKYDSSEQMGRLFDLCEHGYFYTRLANPTNDYVAAKITALEGGVAGILTASGQAASFFAIANICNQGDHVVSSAALYGGTFNLFAVSLKKLGIDFTFVEPTCSAEELAAAFQPNTKAVFGESVANPALTVLDFDKFAAAARAHGVPLIVDNTFPTPINCRPLELGADIVVHSTTKYLDGHATQVGGCIVDGGTFDWQANAARFPGLTQPDDSYHGLVFCDAFGPAAYAAKITTTLMRDFGAQAAPQNAFLLNLGLETLHLRMPAHCRNAYETASWLTTQPQVSWVNYPDLPGNPNHALVQKYLPNGTCGVLTFGVKGGREAAIRFLDNLQLASVATHVADSKTCALHPASTTHRQLSDEQLAAAGVGSDMIRLSIGTEDISDILADLEQALKPLG